MCACVCVCVCVIHLLSDGNVGLRKLLQRSTEEQQETIFDSLYAEQLINLSSTQPHTRELPNRFSST